ncbi:unnamed protein product [Diamesa hyperborea]
MGKKQHQKDKMYLTYTEWSQFYGGKKADNLEHEHIKFKRLPYDFCTIRLIPFENPFCDVDGNIFELQSIVDYIKQFKKNPITGAPLDPKTLIKLTFANNTNDDNEEQNRFQCPALFRQFTKNSHIVAIATSGNVYSYEAVEQLNIKTKNWKDLINDTPFTRKDIITIQNPSELEKFDISKFHHILNKLRVETEEEKLERKDPKGRLQSMTNETKEILKELEANYKESEQQDAIEDKKPDKFNSAHYSTGKVSASFTSTAMDPSVRSEAAIIEEDLVRYERVKKKGYVRLVTSLGPLNLELYCDQLPKTCENFLKHCLSGYYNGTKFHRSIRNFMIQGGDPTGKGNGGMSIWNTKFEDEFRPGMSHSGRGVLSMANSGPNTNGSQFFITFRSCKHLDGKHTIFGKIVGGLDTLTEMERVEVDNKDNPIEDIKIVSAQIFVDPYQEADDQLAEERRSENERLAKEREEQQKTKAELKSKQPLKVFREGIGKYLTKTKAVMKSEPSTSKSIEPPPAKKKKVVNSFNNFKSW